MCCVSVLSRIAVMPKSVCRTSPRSITSPSLGLSRVVALSPLRWTVTEGWNQVPNPASFTFCRSHHTTSSLVVLPGVITSFENAREIKECTISIICR